MELAPTCFLGAIALSDACCSAVRIVALACPMSAAQTSLTERHRSRHVSSDDDAAVVTSGTERY